MKLLHNRILLYRYDRSSYQIIIPLNPKDILIPDTIVEVIISRKWRRKTTNLIKLTTLEKSIRVINI